MNLQDIEAFVALAETGSINRAALRLHITQPAATRRVQNFERALGGPALLDRKVKPASLTPAGRATLARCREVLRAVAELRASAAADEPAGDLRLGVAHGLGDIVLTSPLDELRRRFPKVQLRISSNWTSRLVEEVRSGSLDCAVGFIAESLTLPRNVESATLGAEEVIVVAARDAPILRRRQLRIADLADQRWVLHPPGCGLRAALQRAFDHANVPLRIAAEALEEDLLLSLVARRTGLSVVPRRQLESSPRRPRLGRVKLSDFRLVLDIDLLRGPSLGRLAPVVDQLQARLVARLAG